MDYTFNADMALTENYMIDINEIEVINNSDESRFEAHVAGHLAVLDYRQDDQEIR